VSPYGNLVPPSGNLPASGVTFRPFFAKTPYAGLKAASNAAFNTAKRLDEFTTPKKHQTGAGGKWSKFSQGVDAKAAIKEAIESDSARFLPNSVERSFKIEVPFGRPTGTNEENTIRVIIGEDGKYGQRFP